MVRPGQRVRCASVAANSGTPTPANTTWPSFNWRALRIESSSAVVWWDGLVIEDAPSAARCVQDFFHADHREKFRPRFRAMNIVVEIALHTADRVLVHLRDITFH